MEQTFKTPDQAIPSTDGWMSYEEWAEYRWEKPCTWTRPLEQNPILESELPF